MLQPTAPDRALLARALALAAAEPVPASPNPTVGCVVARGGVDGAVELGRGVSAPAGGPHAEVRALAEAGTAARGATVAVTLEPCRHHGRTPPCTDAVLAAGPARVVIGRADPNAEAAGGAALLGAAGVEVVGPLADDAVLARAIDAELAGFRRRVGDARPMVTLKVAQTPTGALVAPAGERFVTGEAARRGVHRDRARVDAVLVGVGTVLADDPALDARDVDAAHQPRAVVLDRTARTPIRARLVRPGTVLVVGEDADDARVAALEAAGCTVVRVAASAEGVDPAAALSALADLGVATVLAEPGPRVAGALLAAGLVDRVLVHVAADATGDVGAAAVVAVSALALDDWTPVRVGGAGPDRVVELVPPVRRAA